ncbi:MAG: hypothetical protein ACP5I3_10135 [Thermoproteus sp.]
MYRAAVIALALVAAALYLTPSTTPFSPYNPGPYGLSQFAHMCRTSPTADVVVLAPGASAEGLNVTASTAEIVDPLVNLGSPYIPAAYAAPANGSAYYGPVAAPNATPLLGRGTPLILTSPTSFADGDRGPFALALAVKADNKTLYVYNAALFTNLALRWNMGLAKAICTRPVRIVVPYGDPSHYAHEILEAAAPWIAPVLLTTIALYLIYRHRHGPGA